MIPANKLAEIRDQGHTDIMGEVTLRDLVQVGNVLNMNAVERQSICVSSGPGETLRVHVPKEDDA